MTARALAAGLAAALVGAGCGLLGGGRAPSPDERYGHRYGRVAPDGRETVIVAPPDSAGRYLRFPAVLDSVLARPQAPRVAPGVGTGVELLVKGALPDACSELEAPRQERAGRVVTVALEMRQPRGALCAQVVRPFRFYLPLEGTFEAGAYTVLLNGSAYPFQILEAAPAGRP